MVRIHVIGRVSPPLPAAKETLMHPTLPGIHHVTAIAGAPQRSIDFYVGVLGLRMVKQTVNFDDPERYHLYFGNTEGAPGTLLTFFSWPDGTRGRQGIGQFATISLAIPEGALGFWLERLVRFGVAHDHPIRRFGEQVVALKDPDGIPLELVASPAAGQVPGSALGDVPADHAIRRVHGVELWEDDQARTETFLTGVLGFRVDQAEGNRTRLTTGDGGPGTYVELVRATDFWGSVEGVGVIHHVAWRTADDEEEAVWRTFLTGRDLRVTPVRDRQYFRSIYFNEPGGALFEIATDPPGFAIDEAPAELGTHLKLPPQYEGRRAALERSLEPIYPPGTPSPTEMSGP
ncbi:MAG TPA: ring-cleaving dioxygenase [Thermomicrobiales bacterium]|nr:ring-cleaving dioxygenase [Thermomicrobiales bacterium]